MADKYNNFSELVEFETEGVDYAIRSHNRKSSFLVMAPHGGAIEPGTSEISLAIAGNDISYYLFEGIKGAGNRELHITSTNFDEPRALEIAGKSDFIVAVHGEGSESEVVFLGGRDQELKDRIETSLKAWGFHVAKHENPMLQGTSIDNICNRCASKAGVQLEVGKGLREKLFKSLGAEGRKQPTKELDRFASAVKAALK